MSSWREIPHCPECGDRYLDGRTVLSLNAFTEDRVCPFCGEFIHWEGKVERWVSTSVWWKPWTWPRGYWEGKIG